MSEAELDLGFELLEQADRNLAADIGLFGVVSGAVPAPHSPLPDLTIDLTAPGRAYDRLGQRVFFGTGQTVNCAVDLVGVPTDVLTSGNERWVGIFVRFTRLESDPRIDGNSQEVFFRRDESFELVVRQAPEGPSGLAPKPPLPADELLLCDVRRRPGQTQILDSDIDVARRQAFVFLQGTSVAVEVGAWTVLEPEAATVQDSLDEVDAELADHFTGSGRRHPAQQVDYVPHGFLVAPTVQGALDQLVDDLSRTSPGNPGAARVGADEVPGTPHALPIGTVDAQLSQTLGFLNAHVGAQVDAHAASAIGATPHAYVTSGHVQAQLQEIVASLLSTALAASGASRIGVADPAEGLNAANLQGAVDELLLAVGGDHFRANEASTGQHRAIRQPILGSGRVLLWDSRGAGGGAGRLRVYSDADSVWFTVNAAWSGSTWAKDQASPSGAFRLSALEFEILHEASAAASFTSWSRSWKLAMTGSSNGGWQISRGGVEVTGRIGIVGANPGAGARSVLFGHAVTYRSRFLAEPTSITQTPLLMSPDFVTPVGIFMLNRDGFQASTLQTIAAGSNAFWYGTFAAL